MKKLILPLIVLFFLSTVVVAADGGLDNGSGGRSESAENLNTQSVSSTVNNGEINSSNPDPKEPSDESQNLSWWEVLLNYFLD